MKLWLRVEASPSIGLGHLMRTLALAQQARRRGIAATYALDAGSGLSRLPRRQGFPVVNVEGAGDRSWLEAVQSGDVVLFDGYGFTNEDFIAAKLVGARVGAVDDFDRGVFDVDVLVNPNIVLRPRYETPPGCQTLIGPRFALVREEFLARRRPRHGGNRRLLVVLGGSDVGGLTQHVLDLLFAARPFEATLLVAGPASPFIDESRWRGWVTVERDPPEVAAAFDTADVAISTAGATTWELLAMGLPTALIKVADNQREVINVARSGAAIFVGEPPQLENRLPSVARALADIEYQRALSAKALMVVDGQGAERILNALVAED